MADSLSMTMSILDEMRPVIQSIAARLESLDEAEKRRNAGQQQRVQALSNSYKTLATSISRVGAVAQTTFNNITSTLTRAISLTAKWGGALGSLAGVGSLTVLLKQGIQLNAEMEKYRMTLTTVMRSGAQANSMLDWIVRFAERTPFQVQGLAEAATQLEAVGLNARRYLPIIGDMAAAFGGTEEKVQMLIRALSFLKTGVSGEAMESLRRFGISRKDFEDRGIRFRHNGQMLSSGQEGIAALEDIARTKYGGLMEVQAKTFGGIMSNLKDMANNTLRDTVAPLFELVRGKAEGLLGTLNRLRDNGVIREWSHRIGTSLMGAASTIGSVAGEVFGATRDGGIGAGFDTLWENIKEPAGRFIDWFIDKLGKGLAAVWELLKKAWDSHPIATTMGAGFAANRLTGGAVGAGLGSLAGYGLSTVGAAGLGAAGFAGYGLWSLYESAFGDPSASMAGRAGLATRRNIRKSLGKDDESGAAYLAMLARQQAFQAPMVAEMQRQQLGIVNTIFESGQSTNFHLGLNAEISKFGDYGAYALNDLSGNAGGSSLSLRMKMQSPTGQLETLQSQIAAKEGMRSRFTFGNRYGAMSPADASNRIDDGRTFIENRLNLEKEIISLKREEIQLEAKIAEATSKTNQELFKRIQSGGANDRAKEYAATQAALNISRGDLSYQLRKLGEIDPETLGLIEGTGIIDKQTIGLARRNRTAKEARAMFGNELGDFYLNKQVEFDGSGYADRFDAFGKDLAADFKDVVDTLTKELADFGAKLPAAMVDALASILTRAEQLKIAITWPDPLEIQAKFAELGEAQFKKWMEDAVRKALGQGNIQLDPNSSGVAAGVN